MDVKGYKGMEMRGEGQVGHSFLLIYKNLVFKKGLLEFIIIFGTLN